MKKALALVLALVLALSMAVSAFGLNLVILDKDPVAANGAKPVVLSDAYDEAIVNYTTSAGTYYIALEDVPYTDVKVSATGAVTAELVAFNPDTMVLVEWDEETETYVEVPVLFAVTEKGNVIEEGYSYADVLARVAELNNDNKVTYYGFVMTTNVNVIKVTCEDNYTVAYDEGYVKVTAKLGTNTYTGTLHFVSDVVIYEYEEVKWAANNYAAGAYLDLTDLSKGYSDYLTSLVGYGWDYEVENLRNEAEVAVISTTAFRAIEGKNIALACNDGITVTIKSVAAGQKGVNFKHDLGVTDANRDGKIESIYVDFYGKQVVSSEFTVKVATGLTWYTLREAFGVKVEEDDIITYYLLKDGKVVKEYVVDYMTADYNEAVVLSYTGSNETLGSYELVLEVPAVEGGEENPNTGAEAVVGVVAALAVVSVATAAAVSLKK